MNRKGIAPLLIGVIVLALAGAGVAYYTMNINKMEIFNGKEYTFVNYTNTMSISTFWNGVISQSFTYGQTCPLNYEYCEIWLDSGTASKTSFTVPSYQTVATNYNVYSKKATCTGGNTCLFSMYLTYCYKDDQGYFCSLYGPNKYTVVQYHAIMFGVGAKATVCGDNFKDVNEECDPPNKIISDSSLSKGTYKYCSDDCSKVVTINCNDNNPCSTDTFDITTKTCKYSSVNAGSIGSGSDANNCGGDAQEACKFYQCLSGQCVKSDYSGVSQANKCDGTYWCQQGSCVLNPNVQCTSSNDCPVQSFECKSQCVNNLLCSYLTGSVSPRQQCVGNKCQPYTTTSLNTMCGSQSCVASKTCGSQCDAATSCQAVTKTCPVTYCDGTKKCQYAKTSVSCTPTCNNGVCSTCNLDCGSPVCTVDASCGGCTQDIPCGNCGVRKCVDGYLGICEKVTNFETVCGSGYICQ